MPYADPKKKREHSRRRYREKRDYYKRKMKRWRSENPKRSAFLQQRSRAKSRGVEWKLSFDEWEAFWGDDFDLRGRKHFQLQMCRYDDAGAYEVGNIYKATQAENDAGPRPKPVQMPENYAGEPHESIPF